MKALKIALLLAAVTVGFSSCIVPVPVGRPSYHGGPAYRGGGPGYRGGPGHRGPRYHRGPGRHHNHYNGPRRY